MKWAVGITAPWFRYLCRLRHGFGRGEIRGDFMHIVDPIPSNRCCFLSNRSSLCANGCPIRSSRCCFLSSRCCFLSSRCCFLSSRCCFSSSGCCFSSSGCCFSSTRCCFSLQMQSKRAASKPNRLYLNHIPRYMPKTTCITLGYYAK